eukprot:TRINITY_DN1369_c0_g2_i1.p1 TRINITY_DN1369_c0_g2~~TRINITY_DN1369_c0_g2_i1.p1  ORF type:complete len:238 (+),score=87.55 TRINITY_DN1369_c0_g2_i1:208-921(+)
MSGVDFANLFVLLKRGKKHAITGERYKSLKAARDDGAVTVNIGMFLNSLINFIVISAIIFGMVRTINKLKRGTAGSGPKQVRCSLCYMKIDPRASRCPFCASDLTDSLNMRLRHLSSSDDDLVRQDLSQRAADPASPSAASSSPTAAAGTGGGGGGGGRGSVRPLAASTSALTARRNMSAGSLLEPDSDSDSDSEALTLKSKYGGKNSSKIVKKRLTQDFRSMHDWSAWGSGPILPS